MKRIKIALAGGVFSALLLAACGGGGGGAANVKVPTGGFANDSALASTMAWFQQNDLVVAALGKRPTFGPFTGHVNYGLFSSECTDFEDAYIQANQLPAIPNSGADTLWRQALADFRAAISDCEGGVEHRSVSLMKDSNTQLSSGGNTMSLLIFGKKGL
ncbi:MAG TPA: hypothetical protein VGG38_06715 [Acidimicrobiales bacterium]|jgi:hypothetical protein